MQSKEQQVTHGEEGAAKSEKSLGKDLFPSFLTRNGLREAHEWSHLRQAPSVLVINEVCEVTVEVSLAYVLQPSEIFMSLGVKEP